VLAAAHFGAEWGYSDLIAFDMGGTTAKAAVIRDGQTPIRHDFNVGGGTSAGGRREGLPVRMPVIDLAEVGAGGGSVAWIDPGGALRVGPRSAGARPGPACYGFGGSEPTVTDANLLLGYLAADYFLGGSMKLDRERAEAAIADKVARPLGLSTVKAAAAIHDIANANMATAIQLVTVERGIDPREFALIASGGAGPGHVARLAEEFGVRKVIVPPLPGLFSTLGLLASDLGYERVRTVMRAEGSLDAEAVNQIFVELEAEPLAELRREGFPEVDISVQRSVDVRYRHQGYELQVPVPGGGLDRDRVAAIRSDFFRLHGQLFGTVREEPVEYVNLRVRVTGRTRKVRLPEHTTGVSDSQPAPKGTRPVFFREHGGHTAVSVYARERLRRGMTLAGPAVVEEAESTAIVPPGWSATLDRFGALILERRP
jgi:N-methylhydantoinase A